MNKLQRIEEMEKQLSALKAEVEKESEPMFPIFGDGDEYFFIMDNFKTMSDRNNLHQTDLDRFDFANAFTDEKQAQACADYLKDRFWFIRKAIELADGYELARGEQNHYVYYDFDVNGWRFGSSFDDYTFIYMTEESAIEFCEWLNKHKPNGWV